MKYITDHNYKKDEYYPKLVQAVGAILEKKNYIAPVEVLVEIGVLTKEKLEEWRFGQVPYLEKVINCNLSKANRILRILNRHANDLNLKPSTTVYVKLGKGTRIRLRFSKTGDPNLEMAYSTHFVVMNPHKAQDKNETSD